VGVIELVLSKAAADEFFESDARILRASVVAAKKYGSLWWTTTN